MPSARVPGATPAGNLVLPGWTSLLFLHYLLRLRLRLMIQASHPRGPYDHLWVASVVKVVGRVPASGLPRLELIWGPKLSIRQSHVIIKVIALSHNQTIW